MKKIKKTIIFFMAMIGIVSSGIIIYAENFSNRQVENDKEFYEVSISYGSGENQIKSVGDFEVNQFDALPECFDIAVMNHNEFAILDGLGKKIMLFKNEVWVNNIEIDTEDIPVELEYANGTFYVLDLSKQIYQFTVSAENSKSIAKIALDELPILMKYKGSVYAYTDSFSPIQKVSSDVSKEGEVTLKLSSDKQEENDSIIDRIWKDEFTSNDIVFSKASSGMKSESYGELLGVINNESYYLITEVINGGYTFALSIIKEDANGAITSCKQLEKDWKKGAPNLASVDEEGYIYICGSYNDGIRVRRYKMPLTVEATANDMLDTIIRERETQNASKAVTKIAQTRPAANTVAASYSGFQYNIKANNVNRNIPSNVVLHSKVTSITSFPKAFTGVLYSFGRKSDIGEFLEEMSGGYIAGNINTATNNSAAGIDCSGLVCKVYDIGNINAKSFRDKSDYYNRDWNSLCRMDYLACENHIVLFAKKASSTMVSVVDSSASVGKVSQRNVRIDDYPASSYKYKSPWSTGHVALGGWQTNTTSHWKNCGNSCNQQVNKASHVYMGSSGTNKCVTCFYQP